MLTIQTVFPIMVPVLLAMAGVLLIVLARRQQAHDQVMRRLYTHAPSETRSRQRIYRTGLWKLLLRRAGLEPSLSANIGIISGLGLAFVIGFAVAGLAGALLGLLVGLAGIALLGYIAVRRHHQQLLAELPSFLDQIIRSLKIGNSLAGAFRDAADETSGALGPVVRQTVRYMELGYDVGDALTEIARVHSLREFRIMALAVRVNTRYGGSAVEIFRSLIEIVRRRERMLRQLRALTSETRFSAIVLGAMPLLIGGYMVAVNPDYIGNLWENDTGRWVMLAALFWQGLGLLLLWRMVRSIG